LLKLKKLQKYDVRKETTAAPKRILTSMSSNCSFIFSHIDSGSSYGRELRPCSF
jgi:hypothetical protein